MRGAAISGTMRKLAEPTTRLRPGLNIRFISRTSLVARAIRSPAGCESWNCILLPIRLPYISSRVSRSSRWPINSAEKLRATCSRPRVICVMAIRKAVRSRKVVLLGSASRVSKAWPASTAGAPASSAFASAPKKTPKIQIQLRRICDQSQSSGLRRSDFQER